MTSLPIFFTFDNNYVMPASVAFWSLLDRAASGVFYEMYVLHHDITQANQSLLQGIVANKGNGKLSFIDTGDFLGAEWQKGSWDGHQSRTQFTSDTLLRCFAAKFFPTLDKIIYSDVDVVFMDDISELWDFDLGGAYIAGVKNFLMKYCPDELSHLSAEHYKMLKDSYIAGGIWVMNLKKIRADGLEQEMERIIIDDTNIKRWNDQDIINIACKGNVAFLSLNYIAYPYLLSYLHRPDFSSHYSKKELCDSLIHPKILHYAMNKPWIQQVPLGEIWWAIFSHLGLAWKPMSCAQDGDKVKATQKKLNRLARHNKRLLFLCVISCLFAFLGWGLCLVKMFFVQ